VKDTKVFNASDIDDMMVDEVAFLKEFAQAIHVNYNIVDSYLNGAGNSDDDEKKRIIFDTKLKKTFYQNDMDQIYDLLIFPYYDLLEGWEIVLKSLANKNLISKTCSEYILDNYFK